MNVQLGTSLPVATTADQFPVFVAGMDDPIKPVQDKLTPDGRVKYSTGALLRVARKDGTVATDKTASVHVINPPNRGLFDALVKTSRTPEEKAGVVEAWGLAAD